MKVLPLRRPLIALAAAVLAAVPFLSACGGDSVKSVDAEDWVADVCDRFVEYDDASNQLGEKVFEIDFDDAKEAKKDLLAVLAEMKKEFDSLESDFKKTGQPDIKSGSTVRDAFLANFKASREDIEDTIKKVKALDTDTDDFEADVADLFLAIEDENFRDVLEKLADKRDDVWDIVDLIDEDPDCAGIIFDDDTSASEDKVEPSPTKKAGSAATPGKTSTAVARSTPKSNASKNEKYVIGLCVAMTDWMDDVMVLADSLTVSSTASAKQIKDEMVTYFQKALELTTTLRKALSALPVPDGKDGKVIHQAFAQLGADLEKSFADTVSKVKAMDTKSVTQVQTDVEKLSEEFAAAIDEISDKADEIDAKYDTEDLTRISEEVPECAGIF